MGMATMSATISAIRPSSKVTGRRAGSSSATGVLCHSERPKSPCSRMPPIQLDVLLPHRLIEAERGDQLVAAELVGRDVVLAQHQVDDAARNEAHRHEHDEAREEQRRNQRQQAAHDIGLHAWALSGACRFHSLAASRQRKRPIGNRCPTIGPVRHIRGGGNGLGGMAASSAPSVPARPEQPHATTLPDSTVNVGFVKGFGHRPIAKGVGRRRGPVSESLQGKNPRETDSEGSSGAMGISPLRTAYPMRSATGNQDNANWCLAESWSSQAWCGHPIGG